MTRRRYIPPPGYKASTKGHSVLKKWAYGARPFGHVEYDDAAYVERYVPSFVPLHSHYDTGREERDITRHVDSEIYLSSNLMDDVYDTAKKSHNKDAALLREATNAVPPSKRKYHRFDENEMSDITLRRFKSSYVPYQKRTAKAIQPPTNADDGITTRHLKATRVSKKPINTYTPLGTLASRSWKSSKPPPRSYQEETIKHPPDYFDNLISSIPAFTQAIGNIQVSPIPSLTGSPYGSPYMTPRMSPERELGNNNASAPPPQAKPQRRGLRSKHNVGSYYRKLLKRRAANPNRKSKYWPYYDVESIGNSDVAGLVSDDEYEDEYDNNQEGYNYDAYPRDEYYEGPGNTYYVYDTAPSQSLDEYVPFVPRRHNFEDEEDYKCTLPDLPDLGVAPYVPADKNGGSGISEDMAFHNLVAQTASKARRALRDINFNQYDNASLIFSVEGEYTHPERGDVLGFQYIARPLPLKGPNLATGPASSAVRMSDDNSFYKYLNTMRDFRNEIRQRLESGYAALRDVTKTIPSYSSYKPIEPPSASAFKYSYPSHVSTYRNELEGGFGGSISLYPISSRAKTEVALPSAAKEAVPDHTHQVELFDSKPGVKLSTLDKIKIKAALVGSKVDVVLPTGKGRRPRSQYAQSVMRDIKKQEIAQVDDKTTDANVISKNKTRPRPSVTFKRYPSTYVQDMTPKVDDVKRRVKSLLETYKASDIVKGSAQSIIKQTNDKIYTKNTKSDIKPVSRRKLEEKIEIKTAKEEVPSPQATSSLKAHPRVPARRYRAIYY